MKFTLRNKKHDFCLKRFEGAGSFLGPVKGPAMTRMLRVIAGELSIDQ